MHQTDRDEFVIGGRTVRSGNWYTSRFLTTIESGADVLVADTSNGDPIPTLFNWDGYILQTYRFRADDYPRLLLVIDPDGVAWGYDGYAAGPRLARLEVNAWSDAHRGKDVIPTRGDHILFEDCPSCSTGMVEMLRFGELAGYGYCEDCHWSEVGRLFPDYPTPIGCPWPEGIELAVTVTDESAEIEFMYEGALWIEDGPTIADCETLLFSRFSAAYPETVGS